MKNQDSSENKAQMHGAIKPLLQRLGLEEREIDVYLALLGRKTAKASTLSTLAKQSRSHTYLILRSLEKKGLISEVDRGGVLHFVAEPPSRLLSYVQNRTDELQEVNQLLEGAMPFLQSIALPLEGQPRVTLSHGIEGMKQIYRDSLNEEFASLFNPEAMFRMFGVNLGVTLTTQNLQLKGRDLLVNNESSRRYLREIKPDKRYEARMLPPGVVFHTDTLIFGDSIALFGYDSEATIIRIENRNLADAFRAWFDLMWSVCKAAKI